MRKYFLSILLIIIISIAIILYINEKSHNEITTNYVTSIINTSKIIDYSTMLNTSKILIKNNVTESTFTFRYNITIIDFKINVKDIYFNNETKTYTVLLNWTIYVKSNTNYSYPVIFYEYETAEGEGALVASIEEKVYPNKITKIESDYHKVIFKGNEEELYFGIKTFKIIIAYPPPYEPGRGKARLIFYNLNGKFLVYVP